MKNDPYFLIASIIVLLFIFFIGRFFGNIGNYLSLLIIAIFLGRTVGNRLSKSLFFATTVAVSFVGLLWGTILALLFRLFFLWSHPGVILSIVGYGAGLYIAVISYDHFMRNYSLSDSRLDDNQNVMNFVSIGSFLLTSVLLYFLLR